VTTKQRQCASNGRTVTKCASQANVT